MKHFNGMEVSVGKSGKRPTINSYMFGDAVAIARIAGLAGRKELAAEYRAKAERLRQFVETKWWDAEAKFFKTLQRSNHELVTPKNSQDGSVPKLHWMDPEHRGTLEWVQYTFAKPMTFDATEVCWAEGGWRPATTRGRRGGGSSSRAGRPVGLVLPRPDFLSREEADHLMGQDRCIIRQRQRPAGFRRWS